jgi:hypothetical protein
MDDRTVLDLAKVTVDRVRKSIELTTQLIDDEEVIVGVLMVVASDLINGAAYTLHQTRDDKTEEQALGEVLHALLGSIGKKKVEAALRAAAVKR